MPIKCEIVTQERTVYSGDADLISLPGVEGQMGILPNHSPMLTVLNFGEIMVRSGGEENFFAVGGGFAEIQPDKVVILADSAERSDEIDIDRAEKARNRADKAMHNATEEDPDTYAQIAASLQRAQIRIDVGVRRHPGRRKRATLQTLSDEAEN